MAVGLKSLQFTDINDLTPDVTILDWSATRPNELSNFVDSNNLVIAFANTSSPPNLYTDSYTVLIPTGLTGYQILSTFDVQLSWNSSAGSDNYVVQRATDAAFTVDLTTVYDGPLLAVLDTTPGPNDYYYRVLAQVTSLSLNSYWSATFPITVVISTIDFYGVPTSGGVPLLVQFTYVGPTPPIISYLWTFGDGGTSYLRDPSHIYLTSGTYTVSLTISVPGGSASEIKPGYIIVVASPPAADFSASPTDDEYPLEVAFTDLSTSSSTITSWLWDLGDGTITTAQNPTHTYNTPGSYTISLTVTNSYSLSDTETKVDYIRIRGINLIVDFVGVPRDGESPLVVDFTNLTVIPAGHSLLSWLWDFGDGQTSADENPTHVYLSGGLFTVTLKAFVQL